MTVLDPLKLEISWESQDVTLDLSFEKNLGKLCVKIGWTKEILDLQILGHCQLFFYTRIEFWNCRLFFSQCFGNTPCTRRQVAFK